MRPNSDVGKSGEKLRVERDERLALAHRQFDKQGVIRGDTGIHGPDQRSPPQPTRRDGPDAKARRQAQSAKRDTLVDHARARRLGEGWHAAGVPVELDRVETNFVQIDTSRLELPRADVLAVLRDAGVGLSPTYGPTHIRAVTHLDLDDDDIERALELVPAALEAAHALA